MNKLSCRLIVAFTILVSVLSSCYKDKSSLPTNPISAVTIDTAGIATEQFVDYQTRLVIEPKLDAQFQSSNLSYKWQITEKADLNSTKLETIGTQLKLDYLATKPISSKPYYIFLTITDNDHSGLEYIYSWPLVIRGSFISGLVVADTKDEGQTSNLTYIKSKDLSMKYDGEEKIFPDLLQSPSGAPISGKVKKLTYAYWGMTYFGRDSYVWANTEDGKLLKYSIKDFSLVGDLSDEKVVIYKPKDLKVNNHFCAGEYFFLDTSNGVYKISHKARTSETVFSVPERTLADAKISDGVVGTLGNRQNRDGFAIYYDDKAGAIHGLAAYQSYQFHKETFTSATPFDPNNLPGYTSVAADVTEDGKYGRILLKNNAGKYGLYIVKMHVAEKKDYSTGQTLQPEEKATAQSKYTVAQEGEEVLKNAKSIFFSKRNDLFYAVLADKIYAFIYGGSSELKPTEVLYSTANGETITGAKLFIQGEYNFEPALVGTKTLPALPHNCMSLILTIQRGKEGIVRILPIDPNFATSGKLLSNQARDYKGFGTILDVTPIGE